MDSNINPTERVFNHAQTYLALAAFGILVQSGSHLVLVRCEGLLEAHTKTFRITRILNIFMSMIQQLGDLSLSMQHWCRVTKFVQS